MEPARDLQSEGGVVLLVNKIAVGIFQSTPDGTGEPRLVIDKENLFAPFRSHANCLSIACASELKQAGDGVDGEGKDDSVECEREDAVEQDKSTHFARGQLQLMHMVFGLRYAHNFYVDEKAPGKTHAGGLRFPEDSQERTTVARARSR